jgi:hypothetical protein
MRVSMNKQVSETDMKVFGFRASKADIEALRGLARQEAVRRSASVSWADLVRAAIKWMVVSGRPIEAEREERVNREE